MQGFAMALIVTLFLVLLFLVVGLPLIKEIEEARIQRLLIAERMAQHRQQTTLVIAGIIAFVLLSVVAGFFLLYERDNKREHERWMVERRLELEYRYRPSLPPPSPPQREEEPTIIVIEAGGNHPNRGIALALASQQRTLTTRPRVVYANEEGEWQDEIL